MDERTALAKLPRLLAVVAGLLLLVACANIANLWRVRAAQIAASLVMLASAAIVYDTFRRALAVDLGLDARDITVASGNFWVAQLDSAGIIAYGTRAAVCLVANMSFSS